MTSPTVYIMSDACLENKRTKHLISEFQALSSNSGSQFWEEICTTTFTIQDEFSVT
jgi:ribosomal protein L18E